jgi:hypothetical protein
LASMKRPPLSRPPVLLVASVPRRWSGSIPSGAHEVRQPSIRALEVARLSSPAHEGSRGVGAPSMQRLCDSSQPTFRAHHPSNLRKTVGVGTRHTGEVTQSRGRGRAFEVALHGDGLALAARGAAPRRGPAHGLGEAPSFPVRSAPRGRAQRRPRDLDAEDFTGPSSFAPVSACSLGGAFYATTSERGVSRFHPIVRPAKADAFSGSQSRRGKSQRPRSLDGRAEGNRNPEAHRHRHLQDGQRVPGP